MTLDEAMSELAAKGSEATKKLLIKHGAREPFFGVKVGDLKPIHKKLRGEQTLALQLYATGNGDAQYLAGMIADGAKITLNIKKGIIEADGRQFKIEPVPEFMQGIIDAGGLVEYAKDLKEVPVCTR